MESSIPQSHNGLALGRALFFEFLGTMGVVYAFNFTANNYFQRAMTYFAFWVLAVAISGAHFNPATTLAVYLAEGKFGKQIGRLLLYWLFQLMGAFAGILMVYLIFNEPVQGYFLWPSQNIVGNAGATRFFSEFLNVYYGKILFLEMFATFIFCYVYLNVIYSPTLRTVDEILKGIAVALVLYICYAMGAGSGSGLNPALAIAQTCYQVGFLNAFDLDGNRFASACWCYIAFPLIGAIFAAILFRIRVALDNRALKQRDIGVEGREEVAA
eukprot:403368395